MSALTASALASPRVKSRAITLVVAALIGYTAVHFSYSIVHYYSENTDFLTVLTAVREWLTAGRYNLEYGFVYGPLYHVIMLPVAFLPDPVAGRLAVIADVALFVVDVWLIYRCLPTAWRNGRTMLVLGILAFNYVPAIYTITVHKVEVSELLLVIAALAALLAEKESVAGICVGAAASLKFLPGILLGYFVLRFRWRAILTAIATGLAGLALAALVFGPSNLVIHLQRILSESSGALELSYLPVNLNQSITGLILRMSLATSVGLTQLPGVYPTPTILFVALIVRLMIAIIVIALLVKVRPADRRLRLLSDFAIVLATMLLISPFSQAHYAIFLTLSFCVAAAWLVNAPPRAWGWPGGLFLVAYGAVGNFVPLSPLARFTIGGVPGINAWLWYSVPTYGYLVLLASLALLRFGAVQRSAAQTVST